MEFHLPEILTFLIHTVFTRAEGLGVRDPVCRRTCKEHTGESDVSVLSALLRVTQTSFPFCPLHVYCLQNQQNKHKGNKQKFPMQINLSTNSFCSWPLRFHESWGGELSIPAMHGKGRTPEYQTGRCCTQMQDKVSLPKRLILPS